MLDLNTMQNLIEQLAEQLNQAEIIAKTSAGGANPQAAPAPRGGRIAARLAEQASWTPPVQHERKPVEPRRDDSIGRAPVGHLALIAEAVEANRMDVTIEPILGLDDRKARHFEMSMRLIGETGDAFDAEQYMEIAAGTGLLARIDSAKLAHAADVASRLRRRGSPASLFSNMAGESLSDDNFLGAFADILTAEEGLGTKLVLAFGQADARTFSDAHWHAISVMSEIGLKFSLEHVTDLDMDFAKLQKHGFGFVKLDAAVFLEGLPTPDGLVPAADICRHLSRLGLGLIIGGIVEEKDLAKILGFGVLLGQGALFGGPRSVAIERQRRAA